MEEEEDADGLEDAQEIAYGTKRSPSRNNISIVYGQGRAVLTKIEDRKTIVSVTRSAT